MGREEKTEFTGGVVENYFLIFPKIEFLAKDKYLLLHKIK
jgi:hypothetical protein